MSEKRAKDIAEAVRSNDTFAAASSGLSDADRASVEATVDGIAAILAPVVETLDRLEQSEEVMAAVRARLAEKLRGV